MRVNWRVVKWDLINLALAASAILLGYVLLG